MVTTAACRTVHYKNVHFPIPLSFQQQQQQQRQIHTHHKSFGILFTMPSLSSRPHSRPPLLTIGVVALLLLFMCHCSDGYTCAKSGTKVQPFDVQDNGLMFEAPVADEDITLHGILKQEKFSIEMVVPASCSEHMGRIQFEFSDTNNEVKQCEVTTNNQPPPPEKCPTEDGDQCTSSIFTCPFDDLVKNPSAGGRVFNLGMGQLKKFSGACKGKKWRAYFEGVRLVVDSSDPNGETCGGGGLAVWLLVLIIVVAVLVLLAIAGAVVAVFVLRQRQMSAAAQAPNAGIIPELKFSLADRSKTTDGLGVSVPLSAHEKTMKQSFFTKGVMDASTAAKQSVMVGRGASAMDFSKTGGSKMAGTMGASKAGTAMEKTGASVAATAGASKAGTAMEKTGASKMTGTMGASKAGTAMEKTGGSKMATTAGASKAGTAMEKTGGSKMATTAGASKAGTAK